MNDSRLDTKLVAATTRRSDGKSAFTAATMQRIRMTHILNTASKRAKIKHSFLRAHRLLASIAAVLLVSATGFSGYAYANNTNPVSLISRIVSGKDQVKATYQGRTFEYGKNRSYSDAAITAYAELNTVENLASRATGSFGAAKDGVEYFSSPNGYIYPSIGTITSVNGNKVAFTEQYLLGDKITQSHDLDTPISADSTTVQYYANGNPAKLPGNTTSQLVAIYPQTYLAHNIATNQTQNVTVYFMFALTHPLNDFKEADQPTGNHLGDAANTPIYEPNWGDTTNVCYNNPADACSEDKIGHNEGQGMFVGARGGGRQANGIYSPSAIYPAGSDSSMPDDLLQENVQGRIIATDPNGFSIRTSSGNVWQIAYSSSQQAAFASAYSPLKVGDTIALGAEQSISNLNNRKLDATRIMFMMRL